MEYASSKQDRAFGILATLLPLLIILSSVFPAVAGPFDFNVTVQVTGLPSPYATRVFADGSFKGTITGSGSLMVFFKDSGPGIAHTVTVDRYVPYGDYYYGGGYGYSYYGGYNGVAFYAPTSTWSWVGVLANGTTNLFNYIPIFYLSVQSDHGNPRGTGWYLAGSWAAITVDLLADESGGTRYRFDRWDSGSLQYSATNPTNAVYMDSPRTVRALWITQYFVSVQSDRGSVSGGGWFDTGSTATFSVTTPVSGGEGIRYVFTGWGGGYVGSEARGSVIVNRPLTIVANWKTQFWVNVDPSGGQVDQKSQWLDEGSNFTIGATSPTNVVERQSRLVFVKWTGAVLSTDLKVTFPIVSPSLIKANWKTQFYLTLVTPLSQAGGEGWYDEGSPASFSLREDRVPAGFLGWLGVYNLFGSWSGDADIPTATGTVLMDSPKRLTATWTADYSPLYVELAVVGLGIGALIWKHDALIQYIAPRLGRPRAEGRKKKPPPAEFQSLTPSSAKTDEGVVETAKPKPELSRVEKFCSSCGTDIVPDAKFCVECGRPIF